MSQVMNIKSKLHQELVVNRILETDWDGNGSTAPLVVEFDTTEVCNMACPGCISEDLVCNRTSFTSERLLELAEEMFKMGVKAVILIGGGEPLAHPAVGRFIKYLGEHDIHVGITTNGYFLDRYMDDIARYSSWTRVSVDAATPDTFNKLRPCKNGENGFLHIIDNMKQLSVIKKGKLGFSYLIRTQKDGFGIESNISEIYDAAVLAKNIGCDYFELKPSYSYAGGQPHALVRHEKRDMEEARIISEKLDTLETDSFKIIKAINLSASFDGVEVPQTKKYHYCPVSQLRTLVTPSGVYICPYWRGKIPFKIGDAQKMSLTEIWNGELRKKVMRQTDPSVVCDFHCLRHDSNNEIIRMLGLSTDKIEVIPEYDRFI